LAALSLPSLLNRCRTTLLAFVADEPLRGSMPFPRFGLCHLPHSDPCISNCNRAREEELLYILVKLLQLRLWPGSLWAALSDDPTQYCTRQSGMKMTAHEKQLIQSWAQTCPYHKPQKTYSQIQRNDQRLPTSSISTPCSASLRRYLTRARRTGCSSRGEQGDVALLF
jgi:hypothetical protein